MSSDGPLVAPGGAPSTAAARAELDRTLFEEFSRVNNELINTQRELTRTNVELHDSEERLRRLNIELEDRVRARTGELERARVEADRANGAKSAFLAMMSHELRTPMNGVVGMIDVLRETALTSAQGEMVDLIRRSAEAQLAIIGDLLDISKGEAGRIELEARPLQLAEVMRAVCAELEGVAADRGLSMSLFIDPDIPATLLGDRRRLRQVLFNLVGNAIKFSGGNPEHGQVSVRAVLSGRESQAVSIDLIVADRGIGMSEATVGKLFLPFSQADASITRRYGGIGMGLAISDMLVRLMGGTLSVESALGEGSTFTARLRLALAATPQAASRAGRVAPNSLVAAASVPSRDEARRQGRLILVAEDNDMSRRVIARQMELIGFAIDVAVDGRDALQKWRSGDFALLLTDLHMPEMDGYALAKTIRAEEQGTQRKPIIALTADSLRDVESRCLAVGMDAYLTKPVQLPRLKAAIEAGLAHIRMDRNLRAN